MTKHILLKINAKSDEDIEFLSALLQDGLCPISSMHHENNVFSLLVNRFLWEEYHSSKTAYRIHCGLVFNNVRAVRTKINKNTRMLNLLMIKVTAVEGSKKINLIFSNGEIELIADDINCAVSDFHEAWHTNAIPDHGLEMAVGF